MIQLLEVLEVWLRFQNFPKAQSLLHQFDVYLLSLEDLGPFP